MRLLLNIIFSFLLILGLAGCKKADLPKAPAVAPKAAPAQLKGLSKVGDNASSGSEAGKLDKIVDVKRKLIKEGEIRFETSDMDKTTALVRDAVKAVNGYIAKESQDKHGERARINIVIRVPQDRFDELVDKISSSAETIDSKNINTKDVTEEYVDIQARIKTKLEVENRYRQLLTKASKMEDILKIEKQIGDIREEIEAAEGRLRYLHDRSEFSTLTVVYYQRVSGARGFGQRFGDGLIEGWSYLISFFVGLAYIWPFIIMLVGAIYLVLRLRKKKTATKVHEPGTCETSGKEEKGKST